MCGRYYQDAEMEKDILKVIRSIDRRLRREQAKPTQVEVRPTDVSLVLVGGEDGITCSEKSWGYLSRVESGGQGPILHAKCETVLEKKMFSGDMKLHRMVIPATGFYEWNANREKNRFVAKDGSTLYMAGIYHREIDGDRFAIVTTKANASMEPVHDRMPLLLEEEELEDWIYDEQKATALLKKQPKELLRNAEYEQLTLF